MNHVERNSPNNDAKTKLEEAFQHYDKGNDSNFFLIAARESLEVGQLDVLLTFLNTPRNWGLLCFAAWDLVKIIFQVIPDDCRNSFDYGKHEHLLYLVCKSGNAREICLSLNELFTDKPSFPKFELLLNLIREPFGRLRGKISMILSNFLSSIQQNLQSTDRPSDFIDILVAILKFVRVVLTKTRDKLLTTAKSQDDKNVENALLRFLVYLLECPISLLELNMDREESQGVVSTKSHEISTEIVDSLSLLENGSLQRLLEFGFRKEKKLKERWTDEDDEDSVRNDDLSIVGLGCLAFLIYILGIGCFCLPQVTTAKYALDTNIVYMNALTSSRRTAVLSKGLRLLESVLNSVEENTIGYVYIDDKNFLGTVVNLRNIMLHNDEQVIRREALKGFRKIVDALTIRGKYRLLRTLYHGEIQSGFAELLTLILKEEIDKSLRVDGVSWFLGRSLSTFLLDDIFKISPKSMESEFGIVQESNRVLSALNLLRFLLIRDAENRTEIRTHFTRIEATYLKQLRDVVQFSKKGINDLIRENEEGRGKGFVPENNSHVTAFDVTTADGSYLGAGTPAEHLESMKSAYLTLDIVESILARIGKISCEQAIVKTINR